MLKIVIIRKLSNTHYKKKTGTKMKSNENLSKCENDFKVKLKRCILSLFFKTSSVTKPSHPQAGRSTGPEFGS